MKKWLVLGIPSLVIFVLLTTNTIQAAESTKTKIEAILSKMYPKPAGKGTHDKKYSVCMITTIVAHNSGVSGLFKTQASPYVAAPLTSISKEITGCCQTKEEKAALEETFKNSNSVVNNYKTKFNAMDERDLPHLFTADEIITDQLGDIAGCTGDARVFRYYAEKLYPELETRYVITSNVKDYVTSCPKSGVNRNDNMTITGHQIVAVKFPEDKVWKLINTSSNTLSYARGNSGTDPVTIENIDNIGIGKSAGPLKVKYDIDNIKDANLIVAAVLKKDDVFSHEKLMRYSVSGTNSSDLCSMNVK